MDWGKAKNIFIIAFLILNLSLGYQLYIKELESVHSMQWNSNDIDELRLSLRQRDITLNIDIPKESPNMNFLKVKNRIFNSSFNPNDLGLDEEVDLYNLEAKIEKLVYDFSSYKYEISDSNGINYFKYYQVNNKLPFFGAKLEIIINLEEEIILLKQNHFEILSEGMDRQVISSYSAIRTVIDQQLIPSRSEIKGITLGYHGQTGQSSTHLLTPVWRITYRLDDINNDIFVNAMTGGLHNTSSIYN